jgi:pimeloyl-ACP methyl ester carboxylesterase
MATTTSSIEDRPVEACLDELLDYLGVARAHFAGRSLADLQGFVATHPERITSLTLVCPTVLNPRSLAPLGAKLLVVTGDHGLGARRVRAVLPDLPEATVVVLLYRVAQFYEDATGWTERHPRRAFRRILTPGENICGPTEQMLFLKECNNA